MDGKQPLSQWRRPDVDTRLDFFFSSLIGL